MRDPTQQAERLLAIRLRYTINTHLEDQGITTPAAIGVAVGLAPAEAMGLLSRCRRCVHCLSCTVQHLRQARPHVSSKGRT